MNKVIEHLKEALAAATTEQQQSIEHPIEMLRQMLNGPLDDVAYTAKKNDDGSVVVTITVPNRRQRAEQEARRQLDQQKATQPAQTPAPATQEASQSPQPAPAPATTASNGVKIKVAMDSNKSLREKYPDGFLKSMGL